MDIYDNAIITEKVAVKPGIIQARDIVILTLAIYDSKGTEKYSSSKKVQLKEFPVDKEIGVAGVAKLRLTEQPLWWS